MSAQATFLEVANEIGALVEEKNAAYGDSFARCAKILIELYPNGITVESYRDALGIVRVIDKLFRIANRKTAFGESPWKDVAGYGIVAATQDARDSVTRAIDLADGAECDESVFAYVRRVAKEQAPT